MLYDEIFATADAQYPAYEEGVRDFFHFREPYYIFGGSGPVGSGKYYEGYKVAERAFSRFLRQHRRFPNPNESGYSVQRDRVPMATEKQVAYLNYLESRAAPINQLGIDHRYVPRSIVNLLIKIYKGQ